MPKSWPLYENKWLPGQKSRMLPCSQQYWSSCWPSVNVNNYNMSVPYCDLWEDPSSKSFLLRRASLSLCSRASPLPSAGMALIQIQTIPAGSSCLDPIGPSWRSRWLAPYSPAGLQQHPPLPGLPAISAIRPWMFSLNPNSSLAKHVDFIPIE